MVRACILPDEEFQTVSQNAIKNASKDFYHLYAKLFGSKNCTYSIHIVSSHLLQLRLKGPLTETSAFSFESFYGELRRSFVPGTPSPLCQILKNVYLRRALSTHCCQESIYLSNSDTELENNSLIYIFKHGEYEIFKIKNVIEDSVLCNPVGSFAINFAETPELDWNSIGVLKQGGISDATITLKRDKIAGKVLCVANLFVTCPNNVLFEK